jgi:hypothetical protein
MNEQGIAWMVAGGHHDSSPEETRYREQSRALRANRRAVPTLGERLAALIAGQQPAWQPETSAVDCCAAA